MLSRTTGLQGASVITQTKERKNDEECFKTRGGNRLLRAKYGRKSRNDLDVKHGYYFGKATKFEHFWGI